MPGRGIKWAFIMAAVGAMLCAGGPANAKEAKEADETAALRVCSNPIWGGTLYCGGPYATDGVGANYSPYWEFDNGTREVWGIAARANHPDDHHVFTRWRYPNGQMSGWVDQGGKIYSLIWVGRSLTPGYDLWIRGTGGDGDEWCNERRDGGSSWSGWKRCQ